MHLKSLTLALIVSVVGNSETVFSMEGEKADDDILYSIRKLYVIPKIPAIPQPKDEPLILKIEPINLPKITSRGGKTLKILSDPLEISITLANGQSYSCGSKGAEIDISSFVPEGNKHLGQFSVRIKDHTRSFASGARSFLHKNHSEQTMPRCKFTASRDATNSIIEIIYDENVRKFFASGLWALRIH